MEGGFPTTAIAAGSRDSAMAIGTGTGAKWNGRAWRLSRTPLPGYYGELEDVAAIPGTRGRQFWAVGWYWTGEQNHALAERWTGRRWVVVRTPGEPEANLHGVVAFGPANAWAVGHHWVEDAFGDVVSAPFAMRWNGKRWSVVDVPTASPEISDGWLGGVGGTSARNLWAVGSSPAAFEFDAGSFFSAHRTSAGWTPLAHPAPSDDQPLDFFTDVSALDPTNAWAVGISTDPPQNYGWAVTQHWDGHSWEDVPVPRRPGWPTDEGRGGLNAVAALSPSSIWAVGSFGVWPASGIPLMLRWTGTEWQTKDLNGQLDFGGHLTDITRVPGSRRQIFVIGKKEQTPIVLRRC
jgi:hypothetical protein